MSPGQYFRQSAMFQVQKDWVTAQYVQWLNRLNSRKRAAALEELANRACQVLREEERFLASIPNG